MLSKVKEMLLGRTVATVKHIESGITMGFGDVRLWIDSPWRLEKGNVVLAGSGNLVEYLSHEDYKDNYDDCIDLVKSYVATTIVDVDFSEFNELIIKFSSGCTFRTFQDYGDDAENFQLYVEGGRYLVYPNKIEFEDTKNV